ncbi:hypothetical protein KBI5_09035 [Frankia sp. KB5]|nr:hypothetical protein KBI5_09035 [Frankia sp. KB5]
MTPPRRPRAVSVTLRSPDEQAIQQALPIQVSRRRQPDKTAHIPVTASCAGCEERWTDPATTHCGSCHQSWPTVQGFDEHLVDCPAHPVIATRRVKREREPSGANVA